MYWTDTTYSWDSIVEYIEQVRGISYFDSPTEWNNAFKTYVEENNLKYVKFIDENGIGHKGYANAEVYDKWVEGGIWKEVGFDETIGETANTSGATASAPVAKSIVTENTGGGRAVITDEAIGLKNTGLSTPGKAVGILSGLLQVYGLVMTGINAANSQVFKDMVNYAFSDGDPGHAILTPEDPLYKCADFLVNYGITCLTDLNSDGDLTVAIPDTIAERMYNFLSSHMVLEQAPGIYIDISDTINTYYNFIQRSFNVVTGKTLERYFSVSNPDTKYVFEVIDISDDFFKAIVQDAIKQYIGAGFIIATSVATALIASMEGIKQYLLTQSVGDAANAELCRVMISLWRGSTPPPKSTPVSLSEFTLEIRCYDDPRITIDTVEDKKLLETDFSTMPLSSQGLISGSFTQGDNVKYLKRGETGEAADNYAYYARATKYTGSGSGDEWFVRCRYPSNEQQLQYYYNQNNSGFQTHCEINGFASNDTNENGIPDEGYGFYYTNVGYTGKGASYQPDDYLVTAGIRSKTDNIGNPEIHPDPTKTKEEQYPQMADKKQMATSAYNVSTGEQENKIDDYVNVAIPYGTTTAQQIFDHGTDITRDPDAYYNPNSQQDNLNGKVNTNDPASNFGESVQEAIDEFNESRKTPESYPDPLPENYPNPQYPDNPPADPKGDSGDSPTPASMAGVEASGMVSVYNPTKTEVKNFSAWLWTDNVIENLKKILANPVDAIIGMHVLYATPSTDGRGNIICGYLDSGVETKLVDKQYIEVDCQYIDVPEYYGNATDYEPYTSVHIYLPFIGIQTLKANDIMGKRLYVSYGVDVLTGTCLARLTTKKGTSEICCYQFAGNCAVQVPLTGGSYAEVIKGLASMAVGVAGSVATGNPLAAVGGIIGGAMGMSLDVSRSGSLGANAGAMGIRKPYLIITRRSACDANGYNQFYGLPANKTVVLGSCKGYTRVKSVHIDTIPVATDREKSEIETLLKQGVVIK